MKKEINRKLDILSRILVGVIFLLLILTGIGAYKGVFSIIPFTIVFIIIIVYDVGFIAFLFISFISWLIKRRKAKK